MPATKVCHSLALQDSPDALAIEFRLFRLLRLFRLRRRLV